MPSCRDAYDHNKCINNTCNNGAISNMCLLYKKLDNKYFLRSCKPGYNCSSLFQDDETGDDTKILSCPCEPKTYTVRSQFSFWFVLIVILGFLYYMNSGQTSSKHSATHVANADAALNNVLNEWTKPNSNWNSRPAWDQLYPNK